MERGYEREVDRVTGQSVSCNCEAGYTFALENFKTDANSARKDNVGSHSISETQGQKPWQPAVHKVLRRAGRSLQPEPAIQSRHRAYLNPKTGQEFSGVLGFAYNVAYYQTQYQNGVDLHFDWGASQFLTKQFQVGLVGYIYDEIGCDSGSGDRVGCFQSRVFGVGPQVGFIIPINTTTQGYLNIKGYKEFDNANRPDGWNV